MLDGASCTEKNQRHCLFEDHLLSPCNKGTEDLYTPTPARRITILKSSKERGDTLHQTLHENSPIFVHRDCVSWYCSSDHIKRALHHVTGNLDAPAKRLRTEEDKNFNAKKHCLFCGTDCCVDKKHPERTLKFSTCRVKDPIKRSDGQSRTFKEEILQTCDINNDEQSEKVRRRLICISDLPAGDVQYHHKCRVEFMHTVPKEKKRTKNRKSEEDLAFNEFVKIMNSDLSKLWSSVEAFEQYKKCGGQIETRRYFQEKLLSWYGGKLLVFKSAGVVSIFMFAEQAKIMNLTVERNEENKDEDEILKEAVELVGKKISAEVKGLKQQHAGYDTRLNMENMSEMVSPTLSALLSCIDDSLEGNTLPGILIGNTVAGKVNGTYTPLQIALALLLYRKELIRAFSFFGVCCSYDEYLLFLTCAAVEFKNNIHLLADLIGESGLIQVLLDNYDQMLSSMNSSKTGTHALGIVVTKYVSPQSTSEENERSFIPKLPRNTATKELKEYEMDIKHYVGLENPPVPPELSQLTSYTAESLRGQDICYDRAKDLDFIFMRTVCNINCRNDTPEYGGFVSKNARESNSNVIPKTRKAYLPLLKMTPADPTTVLTAISNIKTMLPMADDDFLIFVADQQIYAVLCLVKWNHPVLCKNIYPSLGGFHWKMNVIGCIGYLMDGSGLDTWMKSVFCSVDKMLTGKLHPQNFRALRLCVEVLLEDTISECFSEDELFEVLESRSSMSKTTKLFTECLIKPVLLLMKDHRADRESEFLLHLKVWEMIEALFFSCGHHNYARSSVIDRKNIQTMPPNVLKSYLNGEHTMHHRAGRANGVAGDYFMESTLMRYGHSNRGMIGITESDLGTARWSLSKPAVTQILEDLDDIITPNRNDEITEDKHKDERPSVIEEDRRQRLKLKEELSKYIHPLHPEGHPPSYFNFVTGEICDDDSINAAEAFSVGRALRKNFEENLPDSYYKPLGGKVKNMATAKWKSRTANREEIDPGILLTKVLGLQMTRAVDNKNLWGHHELSTLPLSLFKPDGDMRTGDDKRNLKHALKVEISRRSAGVPDAIIVDFSALLYHIEWPTQGKLSDVTNAVLHFFTPLLENSDVYMVCDRYFNKSPKGWLRVKRSNDRAQHVFGAATVLPSKNTCLGVTENKIQILDHLFHDIPRQLLELNPTKGRCIITGSSPIPIEVHHHTLRNREDLEVHHEEADLVIVNQMSYVAPQTKHISIMADDADIFLLALYHYPRHVEQCKITMETFNRESKVIDITATAAKHKTLVPSLLQLHAFTGSDVSGSYCSIGKQSSLSLLKKKKLRFVFLGNLDFDIADVLEEAIRNLQILYGVAEKCNDAADLRYQVWCKKMGNATHLVLKNLPPTPPAFCRMLSVLITPVRSGIRPVRYTR